MKPWNAVLTRSNFQRRYWRVRNSFNLGEDVFASVHDMVRFTFPGEKRLKPSLNHTHWNMSFQSPTLDQDSEEWEKRIGRCEGTKVDLVDHTEKPENVKIGC